MYIDTAGKARKLNCGLTMTRMTVEKDEAKTKVNAIHSVRNGRIMEEGGKEREEGVSRAKRDRFADSIGDGDG
jgi:hypothetical protein